LIFAGLAFACGRAAPVPELPAGTPPAGYDYVSLRISAFEGPATARAGQPVTVTALVVLPNSCTQHDSTVGAVDDAAGRVSFASRGVEQQEGICTQILVFKPVDVTFTPGRVGTYVLVGPDSQATSAIDVR
jgi:hypothetical protein